LVAPDNGYILFFLTLPEGHSPAFLIQWLGLAELMVAMLFFW
jgi:hypothetical protein